MNHQNGKKKLNFSSKHRKALLRNQSIHFIKFGILRTTSARVKEVRRVVEKIVTLAKGGDSMLIKRRIMKELPYDKSILKKLIEEIAPKYSMRPGGYTRIYRLPQRIQDTASISQLSWV